MLRWYKGPGAKESGEPPDAGKIQENGFSTKPPKGTQPANPWVFIQRDPHSTLTYGTVIKFVLC